ncbi:hypothetical protein CMO83_02665 [Candidatus Woesearchaeota archaeon]|jgi:hypothetical protein|nr:hypothetical protein [Candidatus Woesearchaeota archaeon]|tara:strand:+ start:3866 stop:4171 length:306 start_codon:yes stop_codon:yes gene_type:complete
MGGRTRAFAVDEGPIGRLEEMADNDSRVLLFQIKSAARITKYQIVLSEPLSRGNKEQLLRDYGFPNVRYDYRFNNGNSVLRNQIFLYGEPAQFIMVFHPSE